MGIVRKISFLSDINSKRPLSDSGPTVPVDHNGEGFNKVFQNHHTKILFLERSIQPRGLPLGIGRIRRISRFALCSGVNPAVEHLRVFRQSIELVPAKIFNFLTEN